MISRSLRPRPTFAAGLLALLASLFTLRASAADPREAQLAQALFDEARQLMEQKRFSEACPKFAESQRLDPGGGTLLNLAVCYEGEEKLATALGVFYEALNIAIRENRRDRQDLARTHIAEIEKNVPRVTLVVPPTSDVEGLQLRIDGLALRRAAWGTPMPVDKGTHTVTATAANRAPWSTQVPLDAGEKKNVEIPSLGPAVKLAPPLGPVGAADTAPSEGQGASPQALAPRTQTKPNYVFYGALGVTAVALTVSAATGLAALLNKSTANDGCVEERHYCGDQESRDAADRARTFAWASTISLGVAAIGGVAMILVPSRTTTQLEVGPENAGASIRWSARF